jgi:hypothetical protein
VPYVFQQPSLKEAIKAPVQSVVRVFLPRVGRGAGSPLSCVKEAEFLDVPLVSAFLSAPLARVKILIILLFAALPHLVTNSILGSLSC